MRKTYKQLTTGEKILVGYLYDMYTSFYQSDFVKNSLIFDFVDKLPHKYKEITEYANFPYFLEYKKEKKQIPSLTKLTAETLTKIKERRNKNA